ncbi:MAG: bifunctional 3,4-dihydroxy-2-butanone-4-phosphate synthase/GTP cyclohydrolase II [Armatimonadota bacterium]|nr:bifunctional 3,4-dihydroxy-2-butanone-4-phosphate synthase/GTP cyclohydrolase II [Armatimonadota bacterium]
MQNGICSIEEAIEDFKNGKIVIVVDDEDRENEGDFIMAADKVTPEAINFMAKYGRGLVCLPATKSRMEELELSMMVDNNTALLETPFTVSIDAVHGTTTGISAFDRAQTIKTFIDPNAAPKDLARPGHIFPLAAKDGGVLMRAGHTEAVVDLARLSGLYPAGVLCEILSEDGTMARLPELCQIAEKFDLKIATIADLIKYRRRTEKLVHLAAKTKLPTRFGEFDLYAYETSIEDKPYVALTMGDVTDGQPVLVRIHSSCVTGDVLHSLRCDCGEQLERAMKAIAREGRGILLYIFQEGRGIGLVNKLKAYALQDKGLDTIEANERLGYPADLRDYGLGAQVLIDLGVKKIRYMTNSPSKLAGLLGYDLEIVERVPLVVEPNAASCRYLATKRDRMGHMLGPNLSKEETGHDKDL